MKRENRRIAAMSWGAGDDDGPPKPPKPMTDSTSKLFQLADVDENGENGNPSMTYIVAQNPQVLAKLMRENERRMVNPSSYTTPASVFNVLSVEFQGETTENKPVEEIPLKTVPIPATDLIPLQQENIDIVDASLVPQTSQPSPPILPNPEILGEPAVIYPAMSPSGLPPQVPIDSSKTRSLERNASAAPSVFARISSLERRQQLQEKNNPRSQSLIRQFSAGVQHCEMTPAIRSASLERNQQMYNFKGTFSNSFDKFQNQTPPPPPYIRSMTPSVPKGGSLERSQAIIMNDLMKKYYDQKAVTDAQKPRSGGSLERNSQYQQFLILQKQQLQQQLQAQQQQVQAQKRQQMQAQQMQAQQEEPIEENIYDFGGVHVKSCASIALKKSIERGMLPPTAFRTFESPTPSSGPSSLEMNRPVTPQQSFRHPSPNIASRMMIFQQGTSQPIRSPLVQYQNPMIQSPFPPNQNFYIPPQEPMQIPMQVRRSFSDFFHFRLILFVD